MVVKKLLFIFFYSGISPSPNSTVSKPVDVTIRARRLMKEYNEIKRIQSLRNDPIFTVSFIMVLFSFNLS